MQSAMTGESKTFHFVLATGRAKDNRIPPKGFRVAEAPARMAEPVELGVAAPGLFTAAEYAGGYDDVTRALPPGADAVEVRLFYQTTSREYVEFLRDEINGSGAKTLVSPTPSGEPSAYVAQSDPFFAQLKKWGDTIWELWDHNKDVPGAAPVLMTQASIVVKDACSGPIAPDGAPCTDGDACTTADACSNGACLGGQQASCDDGNPCTDDGCDAALGCTHAPNNAACDDMSLCTTNEVCAYGVCAGAPALCDDNDPCTVNGCDPKSGCVFTPIPDCPEGSGGGGGQGGGGQGGQGGQGGGASSTTSGGQGGEGGGAASTGGSPPPADDDGCGCSIPGAPSSPRALAAASLAALLFAASAGRPRRRRKGS
jgi:hypothetical protein